MLWKKQKPETNTVTSHLSLPQFSFKKQPPPPPPPKKLFSKVAVLNICKNNDGGFVLVAEHRPSYLNFAACCPWNFEADISQNIFN